MFTFAALKTLAEGEFAAMRGTASAEVTAFLEWAEGKHAAIAAAKTLLESSGYTVTGPA